MAFPQIIYTTAAKLNTIAVKDGQIIFVKDTKLLYVDMDTVRTKIDVGTVGATGAKGAKGATGPTGPKGTNATVTIGTVTTGAAGSNAAVTNSGTATAAVLNFTIPRGATGAQGPKGNKGATGKNGTNGTNGTAATITVGTVTSGTTASVTNVGTTSAAKLNFVLPKGATGAKGDTGATGDAGSNGTNGTNATISVGTVTTGAVGSNAVVSISSGKLNFTLPKGATGSKGPTGDKGDTGPKGDAGLNGAITEGIITLTGTDSYGDTATVKISCLLVTTVDGIFILQMYLCVTEGIIHDKRTFTSNTSGPLLYSMLTQSKIKCNYFTKAGSILGPGYSSNVFSYRLQTSAIGKTTLEIDPCGTNIDTDYLYCLL